MSEASPVPRKDSSRVGSIAAFIAISTVAVAFSSVLADRASGADAADQGSRVVTSPNKYNVKVPGGLAFSEFRGYESWEAVSISQNGAVVALIVGNPIAIAAYKAGIPGNGKPFPDGAKLAKIHWSPGPSQLFPVAKVPHTQRNVDFMTKDSKRFADSEGWGFGAFEYDAATDTFTPATLADHPPQGHNAKCGAACHAIAKSRDYVFTQYATR